MALQIVAGRRGSHPQTAHPQTAHPQTVLADRGWRGYRLADAAQPELHAAMSECSAAWLAYLVRNEGVAGSNPATPTIDFNAAAVSWAFRRAFLPGFHGTWHGERKLPRTWRQTGVRSTGNAAAGPLTQPRSPQQTRQNAAAQRLPVAHQPCRGAFVGRPQNPAIFRFNRNWTFTRHLRRSKTGGTGIDGLCWRSSHRAHWQGCRAGLESAPPPWPGGSPCPHRQFVAPRNNRLRRVTPEAAATSLANRIFMLSFVAMCHMLDWIGALVPGICQARQAPAWPRFCPWHPQCWHSLAR